MVDRNDHITEKMRDRLQALRVLIIDDNKFSRSLLVTQLANYGIRDVTECGDGVEGLKRLQQDPLHMILLDYEMTPLNGAEFARMVRRDTSIRNPEIPIIMISGYSDLGHVKEARNAGINEFLGKPVSADVLYKRIEHTLLNPRPFVRKGNYIGPMQREERSPISSETSGSSTAGVF
ncbi:CheY chemotaxis protein or a CheY-like REC (receiver) domain [Rhodospira trueperi]|uniref:CheY chemotaxis protein or a CheY-like REC (Receiver) domain n=1 Tax=Rhodospira trueperi TaxID=69960 RepID=A0A1G7CNC9_9PROT|nr:CheY chemotaxis protein or a CheY-like REC (receiver) domain [Rhodospira trueperi]